MNELRGVNMEDVLHLISTLQYYWGTLVVLFTLIQVL
jgi:hypothetical protein